MPQQNASATTQLNASIQRCPSEGTSRGTNRAVRDSRCGSGCGRRSSRPRRPDRRSSSAHEMASAGKKYRPVTCMSPTIIASASRIPTIVRSIRSQIVSRPCPLIAAISGFAAEGLVGETNDLGRQLCVPDQRGDVRLHDLAVGGEFFARWIRRLPHSPPGPCVPGSAPTRH